MQLQREKKHVIDFLFPIALLFVFAASSFVVIILAANIYSHTTTASSEHYDTRTPVSYVTEKIRQADLHGQVSIGTFDGLESLVLSQQYGEKSYTTYIYAYDGTLMELFIQDGVQAKAKDGTEIMEVNVFHMEETRPGLLRISCESAEGKTMSAYVSFLSRGGGSN
ncbi:MAG: DUF4860 domain-containing protein [Hespellia sp.]|nr:DUF4860 domain-containing protein [Hespellia sp.]